MILGLILGLAAYLLFISRKFAFRVNEGHVGVLNTFGAAELSGKDLRTFPPGLHQKWPWQHSIEVPMMEQNLELSGEKGGQQVMANDGTVLRFDSNLRYVPESGKLKHFLFGMRNPLEHITGLFTCLLRNEIANFETQTQRGRSADSQEGLVLAGGAQEGSYALSKADFADEAGSYSQIRRQRALLNKHIEDFCQTKIGDRYGVRFNAVDLVDILPPDEIADALNGVMQARTEADTAFFNAEGECRQRLLSANEGIAIAKVRAHATEVEIEKLCEYLAELAKSGTLQAYVERRKAEAYAESKTLYVRTGDAHATKGARS
jgi:regulator of protease activity HflC (stomatin/prohibitin superfamily)